MTGQAVDPDGLQPFVVASWKAFGPPLVDSWLPLRCLLSRENFGRVSCLPSATVIVERRPPFAVQPGLLGLAIVATFCVLSVTSFERK